MDRIYFADNPWPNGHRIIKFEWSAHFKYKEEDELAGKAGLYFDFHLETADYYEEDDEEHEYDDEPESDWGAKIVWNNYHSCTLSSTEWDDKGFLVGNDSAPFNPETLDGKEFIIDFLSKDKQEDLDLDLTAFDIYLLGHDAAAFHTIKFTRIEGSTYQIDWKGKLALAYVADYEFRYDFRTFISSASFKGITIPDELTDDKAYELLERFISKPSLFELKHDNGKRQFLLK
ncbi:hypothetical protein [Metabacillus fastidiosus]|uniref:hypothetical protein n=1 Tax=Metabacillus fastidiosus TaxID=1458 RepID=UPI002DBF85F3|nr:hypothetical protein [Metabacillus fastidiosus]MEC2077747.1 hypothetical protein [Metabacillus fastidiosus]